MRSAPPPSWASSSMALSRWRRGSFSGALPMRGPILRAGHPGEPEPVSPVSPEPYPVSNLSCRRLDRDLVLESRCFQALFNRQPDQECRGYADRLGDLFGLLRAHALATLLDVAEVGDGQADELTEVLETHLLRGSPGVKELTNGELA